MITDNPKNRLKVLLKTLNIISISEQVQAQHFKVPYLPEQGKKCAYFLVQLRYFVTSHSMKKMVGRPPKNILHRQVVVYVEVLMDRIYLLPFQ